MKILYANEECENIEDYYSVFLAGPSVRDAETKSWRPELIQLLENNYYIRTDNLLLLIPEPRSGEWLDQYFEQLEWEQKYLELADLLLFWVPRELKHMPAFTTNIEFGMYIMNTDKDLIYGRPDSSPKNKYLDYCYDKFRDAKPFNNLKDLSTQVLGKYITYK